VKLDDLRVETRPVLVRDRALERLRAAIVNGVYKPGDRLIDRELSARMGVSRASVREVVRQLETEGLVQIEPRRGPVVAKTTLEEALDIYEFRMVLEREAVKLFIAKASTGDRQLLKERVEAFADAAGRSDLDAMVEAMAGFYQTLFRGTGNHVFEGVGTRLLTRMSALRRLSMSKPGRLPHSVAEMRALAQAVLAGDVERAVAATDTHIGAARDAAISVMTANQN
jgi:GntR family transcriptional regulator, trigonelline degradation regulator